MCLEGYRRLNVPGKGERRGRRRRQRPVGRRGERREKEEEEWKTKRTISLQRFSSLARILYLRCLV
jgi:hypothetical protein